MSAQDDISKLLSLVPGGASVAGKVTDFENYIRQLAGEGAEAAVKPYLFISFAIGGLGLLFGLRALRIAQGSRKQLSGPKLPRGRRTRYLY